MAQERRLGKGLEALLGRIGNTATPVSVENIVARHIESGSENGVAQTPRCVDIMFLEPNPYQPRKEFDEKELDELSASLQTHGLLQPIVVRQVSGNRFQIIAGERRYRAAMRAGWTEMPVHCLSVDDRQMAELALTENVQRKDLNAIEKATAFAHYLEMYGGTHDELAKRLDLNRSTITNLLRLLELPRLIQEFVQRGTLSEGHVRALLPLKLQPDQMIQVAKTVESEGWSVREVEKYIRDLTKGNVPCDTETDADWHVIGPDGQKRPMQKTSAQMEKLEQEFRERLGGMKVKLTQSNDRGKGKLVIAFSNHSEFERVYKLLCRQNEKKAQ